MSYLNHHLSICPRLSPILPFVARVAIYFTNVLSRYCLLDLALSLIVITYSRHRMTSTILGSRMLRNRPGDCECIVFWSSETNRDHPRDTPSRWQANIFRGDCQSAKGCKLGINLPMLVRMFLYLSWEWERDQLRKCRNFENFFEPFREKLPKLKKSWHVSTSWRLMNQDWTWKDHCIHESYKYLMWYVNQHSTFPFSHKIRTTDVRVRIVTSNPWIGCRKCNWLYCLK
jgi:hypothetical protein